MEPTANELSQFIVSKLASKPTTSRLLVGIAGVPASGKSSLARLIVDKTNALLSSNSVAGQRDIAILVGLDGWHLTRAQLDAMHDPKLAHDRRGAHWTFDGPSYVAFAELLRQDLTTSTPIITAPSFDHALKDPTPHAVPIHPHHRIVVIEGLYTFLAVEPWEDAAKLLDERWFVQVDLDEAKRRLVKRHVLTGVAKDLEEAFWRADENDEPNGKFIADNLYHPTKTIISIDDPVFTPT
ncbi:P-loop containing nucleoside triphosphate hydrolase protein [Leucogyrophana mollusca]|uniref:P-loop containing nucleoside triphosphate hydrolase protein n=1 Tax=Leucogyrophana mollusca TaxID=85980 RepID=A0ACB8B0A8_9AGAM|nr:P-loop containing nucleoside triphosphate hydrolase protein [Leucogyrophana mollusca]